jgi:hypothetical protein
MIRSALNVISVTVEWTIYIDSDQGKCTATIFPLTVHGLKSMQYTLLCA